MQPVAGLAHKPGSERGDRKMSERIKKQKDNITIRSSAAEYLTFVASTGDSAESIEMRYEDENIWLRQFRVRGEVNYPKISDSSI